MQNFITVAAFFLVENKGLGESENNAKHYGHFIALAHALHSDQFIQWQQSGWTAHRQKGRMLKKNTL